MRQITRISPAVLTGMDNNIPEYEYNEEIIVGADATRYRNGEVESSCLMGEGTSIDGSAIIGQTVVGRYNAPASNSLFIIGNGSRMSRSNIVEVSETIFSIKKDLKVEGASILKSVTVNGNTKITGTLEASTLQVNNNLTVNGVIKGTMQNSSGTSYVTTKTSDLENYYTTDIIDSKLSNYLTTETWNSKVTGSANWNWAGQPGQPTWLWGGNEIGNFYVYNPANFNVAYAESSRKAEHATTADSASTAAGLEISGLGSVKRSEQGDLELSSVNSLVLNPDGRASNNNFIYLKNTYDNQRDLDGRTLKIDSDGELYTPESSSKRFKEYIEDVSATQLSPHLLYKIPVKQYYYKNKEFKGLKIGLIAEDVAEIYPVAAIYDDIGPENWDERYIIPPMLKLIQEQHEDIEKLKEEIQKLKGNS